MRLVIVSNRLPVTFHGDMSGAGFKRSIGGLVTGIESYIGRIDKGETPFDDYLWVGWPGVSVKKSEQSNLHSYCLREFKYLPVFLSEEIIEEYYCGFCNKTIWPLFHYFPNYVHHNKLLWDSYQEANNLFFLTLKEYLQKDDVIWVHDYHLMLLPQLIRKEFPEAIISFFLHIPFPEFDIFRHLSKPEQTDILEGLLGANVLGFHTYGYAHDFLQCVYKVLKLDNTQHELIREDRRIKVDIFPMGIDYRNIRDIALSKACEEARMEIVNDFTGYKLILSIDRLDYTKGILNRLKAFDMLLAMFPEWRGKVVLLLVVAPSRREISYYGQIKHSIDEWVGRINGTYGTYTWTPVVYQYRQVDLLDLCALYAASDIALVTPLKDGMNLMAKEYLAAHTDKKGVLILSEMAGAVHELAGAISVNPYNIEEMVQALVKGLTMDGEVQYASNEKMHERLENYDVVKWAHEIMEATLKSNKQKHFRSAKILNRETKDHIIHQYKIAESCLFLLDYDGTLSPFARRPELAKPNVELLQLLKKISGKTGNKVVIVSGRDRQTLEHWFGGYDISFCADLGAWVNGNNDWEMLYEFDRAWKGNIKPLLNKYASRLPFSYVEEKECAFVLDYRMADPELRNLRISELTGELQADTNLTPHLDVLQGENSFIIRNAGSNKGTAVTYWLDKHRYDFILAIGDDDVDEELFAALPKDAYTVRVGTNKTAAKYYTPEQHLAVDLLGDLIL
jgi:trehalose 6-phosphate synthase/phosphatase